MKCRPGPDYIVYKADKRAAIKKKNPSKMEGFFFKMKKIKEVGILRFSGKAW